MPISPAMIASALGTAVSHHGHVADAIDSHINALGNGTSNALDGGVAPTSLCTRIADE